MLVLRNIRYKDPCKKFSMVSGTVFKNGAWYFGLRQSTLICCCAILKLPSKKENSSGYRKHNVQRPGGKKVLSCSGSGENSQIPELRGRILKGINALLRGFGFVFRAIGSPRRVLRGVRESDLHFRKFVLAET